MRFTADRFDEVTTSTIGECQQQQQQQRRQPGTQHAAAAALTRPLSASMQGSTFGSSTLPSMGSGSNWQCGEWGTRGRLAVRHTGGSALFASHCSLIVLACWGCAGTQQAKSVSGRSQAATTGARKASYSVSCLSPPPDRTSRKQQRNKYTTRLPWCFEQHSGVACLASCEPCHSSCRMCAWPEAASYPTHTTRTPAPLQCMM